MSYTQHSRLSTQDLVDTHAHLDSFSDVAEVIDRANQAGVQKIVVPAFSLPCSEFNLTIASEHKYLYPAIGVHPHSAKEVDEEAKAKLTNLAKVQRVVAIGETGLDYHYEYSTKERQKEIFKWHIALANKLSLPLIVHSREAFEDSFDILKSEGIPGKGFVFHAFAGETAQAQEAIDSGGLISVTGVLTFKNAPQLQEVVKYLPLEKMMVETDSPYLTPHPYRGQTNEPKNVVFVAQKIAELKGLTFEEVAQTTTKTAKNFFNI